MFNVTLLEQKLLEKNLMQKDLAEMLNLDKTAISAWKKGVYPKAVTLIKLCELLDISADDLLNIPKKKDHPSLEEELDISADDLLNIPEKKDHPSPEEENLLKNYQETDKREKQYIQEIAKKEKRKNNNFYELFEIARDKKGLSNADVARAIGVTAASMTGWKKGSMPTIDKLKATCKLLDVSADYLLGLNLTHCATNLKLPDKIIKEEYILIDYYRSSDERGKENIMNKAKIEASRKHPMEELSNSKVG